MPKSNDKPANAKVRNVKRKRKQPPVAKGNKKRKREEEKVLYYGFECIHCPKDKSSDSDKEKQEKYLQRLILTRKSTYDSESKGHSLWVNYGAVHCRDFHETETSKPTVRVKKGQIVTEETGGSIISKRNLIQYKLTRKQYKERNTLNTTRRATLKEKKGMYFS